MLLHRSALFCVHVGTSLPKLSRAIFVKRKLLSALRSAGPQNETARLHPAGQGTAGPCLQAGPPPVQRYTDSQL